LGISTNFLLPVQNEASGCQWEGPLDVLLIGGKVLSVGTARVTCSADKIEKAEKRKNATCFANMENGVLQRPVNIALPFSGEAKGKKNRYAVQKRP